MGPTATTTSVGCSDTRVTYLLISPQHLYWAILVVIGYAVLEATEMVGLWFAQRWAEYLTFVATTLLIPLEIYEIVHKVSVLKVITLVINLAIVVYLLFAKIGSSGVRGGFKAEERRRRTLGGGPPSNRVSAEAEPAGAGMGGGLPPSAGQVLDAARGASIGAAVEPGGIE